MPSEKYSWAGSPLTFVNGKTTIESRAGLAKGLSVRRRQGRQGNSGVRTPSVGSDRARDILEFLLAHVREAEIVADLLAHHRRDADAVDRGQRFQPGRDIDAVTGNVVAVDDDIADIDSDPEPDTVGRDLSLLEFHDGALNIETALHGGDGAAELGQEPVAGGADDPAAVFFHLEKIHLFTQAAQSRKRQRFVALHQAAEARDVGKHDRGELANGR